MTDREIWDRYMGGVTPTTELKFYDEGTTAEWIVEELELFGGLVPDSDSDRQVLIRVLRLAQKGIE